jgi:endonuclease/exonuclease/phosphatase family metal-dependent hydrolase
MIIASLNIMAERFSNIELIDVIHRKWSNRFELFKKEVIRINPSVLALQEVDCVEDVKMFMESIGYDAFNSATKIKKGNVCLMIFVKKEIEKRVECISIAPKEYQNGHTKILICDLKDNDNQNVRIINVHLKARLSCEDIRLAQLELIKEHFTENTIVLGDFNATPKSKTIEKFIEMNFKSVYPLNEKLITFSARVDHNTNPGELHYQDEMFDYIFYNSDINVKSKIDIPTLEEAKNKFPKYGLPHLDFSPSDHLFIGFEAV